MKMYMNMNRKDYWSMKMNMKMCIRIKMKMNGN